MRFVLAGGVFVPASALVAGDPGTRPAGAGPVPLRLSPREREVADRLCAGKPNKTIARELEISESTVKVFVRRILTKVGASNRTEAAYLVRTRLRTPGERRPTVSAARV
jgi:DNA-binding NarL/FixJ family response regulator